MPRSSLPGRPAAAIAILLLVLAIAGCGGSQGTGSVDDPKLSADRAREIAQDAIEAFSACDHDAWTANWADSLKAESSPAEFARYCNGYVLAYGQLEAIEAVEHVPAATSGYVRWNVKARFGTGPVTFSFVIHAAGEEIAGYSIDPPR